MNEKIELTSSQRNSWEKYGQKWFMILDLLFSLP
jgi:hypothetical protein